MELVEPIKEIKKLEKMKKYLKARNLRDYCLFVLGINSGLRVSDLLNLKIGDVVENGKMQQEHFTICDANKWLRRSVPSQVVYECTRGSYDSGAAMTILKW